MAAVSVSANNTRVEDAESATGWTSIGGGAGGAAEGSFPYQGANLYNRKVTGNTGFYYAPTADGGSAQDMTSAAKTAWMVKAIVTDYGGLNSTQGLEVRIGSGTGAYYVYEIAGSNANIASLQSYPATGGFIIIPIDPNIAGWRESTTGSPNLTTTNYFALVANFTSSTAKSENVGLDAIDLGTGLTLIGGDGADPDGEFQDFVDTDQGVTSNRWGYATASRGVISLFGMMTIGSSSATVFTDNASKVLFPNGLFAPGYSGVTVDLQNASTNVTIGCQLTGLGSTTTSDTRPDYTVTGTSGSHTLTGVLENFRNVTLTSACTVSGAVIEAADVTVSTATISDTEFRTNTASGVAMINDFSASDMSGCIFTQVGSGHAIEITTPGTYTFNNLLFDSFGADGTTSAAVYNNSGGSVTINVSGGGDTPTVRNGTGASTTISNTINVTLAGLPTGGVEVRIYDDTGTPGSPVAGTEIAGNENVTSGSFSFSDSANNNVIIVVFDTVNTREGVYLQYTIPTSDASIPFTLLADRNYLNP